MWTKMDRNGPNETEVDKKGWCGPIGLKWTNVDQNGSWCGSKWV